MEARLTKRYIEREFVAGGIAAGLIGGVLMAALEGVISYSNGLGFFAPLAVIDGVFRGANANAQGWTATNALVGAIIHLVLSGCLGGIFAIAYGFFRRLTAMLDAFWAGVVFGVIVCAAVNQVFLLDSRPDVGLMMSVTPEKWFLAHIVFGASLGLTPVLARLFDREAEEEFEREEDLQAAA
jgi:hypothetical protein